ncbi:glycosyltransferase [Methanosarcina sp.]|uniref:glycosyltransferase n=1 Tax=Methanosarcina sp. TaxID=2213 RepID=UPI0029886649|nr:glycosyltransferase [Methanosarcina sp.]MDW5549188.1 glycosyltransferase [Methanosarcina sp.]MDW5553106.1 glycosyltransferase [Methanosarcina sp.]MDW5559368.1 glycosyltransferase [Methanosarcina sp.]
MIKSIIGDYKKNKKITNFFEQTFKKNVLISYTIFPFVSKKIMHTNFQESHIIAKVFNELGYCVDIVHYTNNKSIDYSKYDIVFGFGEPFENSYTSEKKLKRVYYATGAHVCYQNHAEIKRVKEVNKKHGSNILPKRLVPWNWSMSTCMSDAIIVVGNEWTKSTYVGYCDLNVYTINATAFINTKTKFINREIEVAKKNYLWFGSSGLILKGLDLCLEYFSHRKDMFLHVCGPVEKDFFEVFSEMLNQKNIHFHGYIDVQSDKFVEIVSQCLFAIMPTCSEGQSTALLTAMGGGLIPISSLYSGVDVGKFGFLIDSLDIKDIEKTIDKISLESNETLELLSAKSQQYIFSNHQVRNFEINLKQLIEKIIE